MVEFEDALGNVRVSNRISDSSAEQTFVSKTSSLVTSSDMAPAQPRDKRRFYVKKMAIGINRFKEWEEQIGDSWYRHHNKVNNIVYYHCKHEPCYASMKAKIMVDFVQLYVTEEGHTHPPFANSVAALSELTPPQSSAEFVNVDCKSQMIGSVSEQGALLSTKRRRVGEEQPSKGIPLIYQQQLLQLLHMQGDPITESLIAENRQVSPSGFQVDSFLMPVEQTKQNQQTQPEAETTSASFVVRHHSDESCTDGANCMETKPSILLMNNGDQKQSTSEAADLPLEQTASNPCESNSLISPCSSSETRTVADACGTARCSASAIRSPQSEAKESDNDDDSLKSLSGTARCSASAIRSPQSEAKESDNDDDSLDSEQSSDDSLSSSTPISLKVEEINQVNVVTNGGESDEIFAMIKSRVESKPRRKRLAFLRKLKRQLSYFVEMEEVRLLSARLPANTKFDDVFHFQHL
ncbi:hypothetical protein Tcan_10471 [Toxocara canis]|uniref:Uncharacterized protein n=1 Tax=Toxocara canis TaxID=6265 RepID=A0A0B2V112_TOXCA|nr:hypothetical protein Tcan_10471 [Toxocara canis]